MGDRSFYTLIFFSSLIILANYYGEFSAEYDWKNWKVYVILIFAVIYFFFVATVLFVKLEK